MTQSATFLPTPFRAMSFSLTTSASSSSLQALMPASTAPGASPNSARSVASEDSMNPARYPNPSSRSVVPSLIGNASGEGKRLYVVDRVSASVESGSSSSSSGGLKCCDSLCINDAIRGIWLFVEVIKL